MDKFINNTDIFCIFLEYLPTIYEFDCFARVNKLTFEQTKFIIQEKRVNIQHFLHQEELKNSSVAVIFCFCMPF